jgi:hypothetical protein
VDFRIGIVGAAVALALVGCASIQRSDTLSDERTLAAAGFQMKFAKTPDQVTQANALPQLKLTRVPGPDGGNRFVYADAKYCQCVYVGTEAAYDRYQKLAITQQIAQSEEMASMNWGMWGAWGPWY